MQSGGGGGRPPSASASPSSSSSAVSQPQFLIGDKMVDEYVRQQRQYEQQLLRNEGREALLAYQSGSRQGVPGGGPVSSSGSRQQQRVPQQHGQEEGQNIRQGFDQQMMNPYMQFTLQAQQAHTLPFF